jgi:ketosteroid isomerase-like protein
MGAGCGSSRAPGREVKAPRYPIGQEEVLVSSPALLLECVTRSLQQESIEPRATATNRGVASRLTLTIQPRRRIGSFDEIEGGFVKQTFLAIILAFTTTVCASAQTDTDATKSKIVALEQSWNQAYKSGDTKALDAILDDGIVLVNDDGSVQSKEEFLASVKSSTPQPTAQQQQVAPESFSVRVFGNVAIATGVMRVKGIENGKPYTRRERFVDTWLQKQGNWVCIGTDATPVLH